MFDASGADLGVFGGYGVGYVTYLYPLSLFIWVVVWMVVG